MTHIGNVKTHYDDSNNKVSCVLTLKIKAPYNISAIYYISQ